MHESAIHFDTLDMVEPASAQPAGSFSSAPQPRKNHSIFSYIL